MTESTAEATAAEQDFIGSLRERLGSNPVVLKELRGRMRGARAFALLTAYLGIISAVTGGVYFSVLSANNAFYDPDLRQVMGRALFGVVVMLQLAMVSFVAPALTAGAISSERERKTYDLLRTTLLSARALVGGKIISALTFLLLLLVAALPLQSIAYLFGGVTLVELLISTVMLVVTTILFCAFGLFFSSLIKHTLPATVLAYAVSNLLVFGLPFLILFAFLLLNPVFAVVPLSSSGQPALILESAIFYLGWLLVSLNPLSAALISELLLLDQQALISTTVPFTGSRQFFILSPWISYSLIYLGLSGALYLLSIRLVKRKDK